MPSWVWVAIAVMVVVAAVVLVIAVVVGRRKRTERLKARFGPEYERTVTAAGGEPAAEKELLKREHRRDKLDVVGLPPAALQEYARRWRSVQTAFVDDPTSALVEADRLVNEVMGARGYPVEDFDQRAADISVDHPAIVENYRAAHDIHLSSRRGEVGTETQRQAFVHYRALFGTLLDAAEPDKPTSPNTGTAQEAST
jgi:hypothetical protein